jgi:hypothetical protein
LVHENIENTSSELDFTAAHVNGAVSDVRGVTFLENAGRGEILGEKVRLVGRVTNFVGFARIVSDASETLFHHFTGFVEFVNIGA